MARDLVGKVVGGYRLGEILGRGGASTVYEAEHSSSGRKVAVKVFTADFSKDKNAAPRMVGELQKATAARHPNVVEVLESGTVEIKGKRHVYLVMERLHGETLSARLGRQHALPLHQALQIASDVGAALQAIHRQGTSHRAVSAGAVFLCQRPDGAGEGDEIPVRLLDLGSAQIATAEGGGAQPPADAAQKDDLRALALLLQEMLGGASSPPAGASQPILPLRLKNREVPVHVDAAIRAAITDPGQQRPGGPGFATVAAFVAAILGSESVPAYGVWSADGTTAPPSGRSGLPMGWVVLGLALISGIGWWLYHREAPPLPAITDLAQPAPVADLAVAVDQRAPVADLAAAPADLTSGPDLLPMVEPIRKPHPRRTGPPIPPVRGPIDVNPSARADAAGTAAAPAAPVKKRPRRTGPPIPPLRLRL